MRLLIAGMGSIGSLLAGYLVEKSEVWLLGRSWHLNPIKEKGFLTIELPSGKEERRKFTPALLAETPHELTVRKFDVIFITVKAYDTRTILKQLEEAKITANCYVLFQNGLGNENIAQDILSTSVPLLRGITNNGAHIPSPGKVIHAGRGTTKFGSIIGGKDTTRWSGQLVRLFRNCGLKADHVTDMQQLLWEKVAINAVINPLTALLGVKNEAISEISELKRLGILILKEIKQVAKAEEVELEEIKSHVFNIARKTGENWSSMAQDIKQGNRTEIDFINGAVAKKARKCKIATPLNRALFLLVKVLEKRDKFQ